MSGFSTTAARLYVAFGMHDDAAECRKLFDSLVQSQLPARIDQEVERLGNDLLKGSEDAARAAGQKMRAPHSVNSMGVSAEQADAQLQSLRQYWSETYPEHHAKGHFAVSRPLHEDIVGEQRDAFFLLCGAVVFVLLIVCVNLAALLISNGEARRREF